MANIRFDNFSGDTVTVFLDGKSETVEEDGRVNFDALEKGKHSLRIHRARVPLESSDMHDEQKKSFMEEMQGQDKTLHAPLDFNATLELDSSKSVITVKSDITSEEGKGLDVIFASYSLSATGARIKDERKTFANETVKKRFLSYHISNSFFPVGIGSLAVFIIAICALIFAASGKPINLGGTVFTLPWALMLTAAAIAFFSYFVFSLVNIFKTAKRLSFKEEMDGKTDRR